MVSHESLVECFEEFGIEPSADVIKRCIEICTRNGIDNSGDFVDTWMAYSVSKLSGAEPTLDYLRDMESHEFANKARVKQTAPAPPLLVKNVHNGPRESLGNDRGQDGLVIYKNVELDSAANEVLGSYGCVTPKQKKSVSRLTHFSPASYQPIASRSQSQEGPNNSGNVVYTFGNGQLLKQVSWSSVVNDRRKPVTIEIQLSDKNLAAGTSGLDKYLSDECKYMFDSSYERALILGDRVYEGGSQICLRLAELRREEKQTQSTQNSSEQEESEIQKDDRESSLIEAVTIHHVDYPSTDVVSVMGRIVSLDHRKDVAIVDFDEMTLRLTNLDFSRMKTWSMFPGEIVVLEGVNPRGKMFEVQNIHFERQLEPPRAPMKIKSELNMVIASGPFTYKEDLAYEKLSDLLAYCSNNCPDVLILTGPFGSSSNPLFETIAETYENYFEKLMMNIMSSVPPSTQVLVVSNHDDIMSMFVYPSFPYKIRSYFPNLRFLPDPCVVSINGLKIGITTADIIKDLSDAELSRDPRGDKIKRAFSYMFHHKTFYPLCPPPEHVPLDLDLLQAFGKLSRVPNMMICPGDLKCYIRDCHGCVCINPGRLSDQDSGEGTFARVVVHPPESETAAPFNYVTCQVVKS
ncbi:DNA polymerase alpha subunit B [Armigeres subalbatus]|uniref:DNA polymerase alpha subunit B n=1 Tax=Armigeres subalbatus TaxID=124917 RepID=UPI002ED028C9